MLKEFRQFLTSPKATRRGMFFKYLVWAVLGALLGASLYVFAPAWIAAIATVVGFKIGWGLAIVGGVLAGDVLGLMGTFVATLAGAKPDDSDLVNEPTERERLYAEAAKKLYQAARDGDAAVIHDLVTALKSEEDQPAMSPMLGSDELDKALYIAAKHGHVKVAKALLKRRAICVKSIELEGQDPYLEYPKTEMALEHALTHKNDSMIQAFIDSFDQADGLLRSLIRLNFQPCYHGSYGGVSDQLFNYITKHNPAQITPAVLEAASSYDCGFNESAKKVLEAILANPETYTSISKEAKERICIEAFECYRYEFVEVCLQKGVQLSDNMVGDSLKGESLLTHVMKGVDGVDSRRAGLEFLGRHPQIFSVNACNQDGQTGHDIAVALLYPGDSVAWLESHGAVARDPDQGQASAPGRASGFGMHAQPKAGDAAAQRKGTPPPGSTPPK